MRVILAALLALMAAGCEAKPVKSETVTMVVPRAAAPELDSRIKTAWAYACTYYLADCSSIEEPNVVLTSDLNHESQGYYINGDYEVSVALVYANDPYLVVVLAHEMLHYLQWDKLGDNKDKASQCAREKEAFALDHNVGIALGLEAHPDAFEWDDHIERDVYHCAPDQLKPKPKRKPHP